MKFLHTLLHMLWSFIYFLRNEKGSDQIDEAFVEGFKDTIYLVTQQKNTKLFNRSRQETQSVETDFYERIGDTEAEDIIERHGDTPIMNTPHSRRGCDLQDADWGDMIDKLDRVRLLIRPDDAYVQTAVMAMNRKKDDVFIAAILGNARTGRRGTVNVALPNTQKLVTVDEDGVTGSSRFNVYTLTLAQYIFDENDVDEDIKRYWAWSPKAKQNLLNETQATSSEFASVKALVKGDIKEFMGFEFILTTRLPVTAAATTYTKADGTVGAGAGTLAAGARRMVTWAEDGMISATAVDLQADIGPRRDKKMSTQIYVCHSVGGVRMEEEKVLEVLLDETL